MRSCYNYSETEFLGCGEEFLEIVHHGGDVSRDLFDVEDNAVVASFWDLRNVSCDLLHHSTIPHNRSTTYSQISLLTTRSFVVHIHLNAF